MSFFYPFFVLLQLDCTFLRQSLSERVSELEAANRLANAELAEYRAESAHLKNQQATVRRLEERNKQLELQVIIILFILRCINNSFLFGFL